MIKKFNEHYILTKTLILNGIQCKKKLWFEKNDKIKVGAKAQFEAGNRFNNIIRKNYGQGLDLSDEFDYNIAVNKTNEAIKSNKVNVIYEAAFIYNQTYVRADVLIKKDTHWILLEAKSATKVKDINIFDIAIQSYIIKKCGLNINSMKLIFINNDFVYKGDKNYLDLIKVKDLTDKVLIKEKEVENLIKDFIPIIDNDCPDIQVGKQCKDPYPCQYLNRCSPPEKNIKKVSYQILPYHGKILQKFCEDNNISKLIDVPKEKLKSNRKDYAKDFHYMIQQAHKFNAPWISKNIEENFKDWVWPFYFMDFETVQQIVPIIKNTKPYEQLPFQWSIHRWDKPENDLKNFSFLNFDNQKIESIFLEKLVKTIGNTGTIFVHNHPFEKGVLNRLKEKPNLIHYEKDIENIINRITDTLELTRKNFYSPQMFGKYSLKNIVKGIPTSISYDSEDDQSVSDGSDAQLAWFICTDSKSKNDKKEKQREELIKYCAKDTHAMYDLIKYLINIKS